MRIIHLPGNVAGGPAGLVEGERALGHESRILCLAPPAFGFSADEVLDLATHSRMGRWWTYARTLARIRSGYDLYHFNFGSSLLDYPERGLRLLDLPLYDRRAKKVFSYQGCDARQKYATIARGRTNSQPYAACFNERCYGGVCNSAARDKVRRQGIEKAARYADHLFAFNPDLLYFLPSGHSSFLPYAIAGFHAITSHVPALDDRPIHIVHATTEPIAKGSVFIDAAARTLVQESPARVRYSRIEGVSHQQARAKIADADLYVDQLLIGWYGGAAVEAMKMGVPVIAFINDDHLRFVPCEMASQLPVVRANPGSILSVMRSLIADRDRLREIGANSLAFVNCWHAPERVAAMALARIFSDLKQRAVAAPVAA